MGRRLVGLLVALATCGAVSTGVAAQEKGATPSAGTTQEKEATPPAGTTQEKEATPPAGTTQEGAAEQETANGATPWKPPTYAVPILNSDCFGRRCGEVQITDVFLSTTHRDGTGEQEGGFRLRASDRAYIGVQWGEHRKAVTVTTSRVDLLYEETDGRRLALDVRATRVRLGVQANQRSKVNGGGWQLAGTAAVRFGPDFEAELTGVRDLQGQTPLFLPPRTRTLGRAGILWQRGNRFELRSGLRVARQRDGLGEGRNLWGADASATLLLEPVELRFDADYANSRGRFSRRELEVGFEARARLMGHFLAQAGLHERVELGVSEISRTASAGLSWFGRRYRFPRGSEAAARVLALTRQARALGYNERRVYDIDGMRSLRERLSLAGMDEPVQALYRATVESRNVPQFSLRVEQEDHQDVALRIRTLHAAVAVPWPLTAPWRASETSVEFLRLGFRYEEEKIGGTLLETGRAVDFDALLNRELTARFAWSNPMRTPLDLALGLTQSSRFTVSLEYAFWR